MQGVATLKIAMCRKNSSFHYIYVVMIMYKSISLLANLVMLKYNQECFVWLLIVYQVYGKKTFFWLLFQIL